MVGLGPVWSGNHEICRVLNYPRGEILLAAIVLSVY